MACGTLTYKNSFKLNKCNKSYCICYKYVILRLLKVNPPLAFLIFNQIFLKINFFFRKYMLQKTHLIIHTPLNDSFINKLSNFEIMSY